VVAYVSSSWISPEAVPKARPTQPKEPVPAASGGPASSS
jgi:hypothetical protein